MMTKEQLKKVQNAKVTPKFLDSPKGREAWEEGSDLAFGIDDDKN